MEGGFGVSFVLVEGSGMTFPGHFFAHKKRQLTKHSGSTAYSLTRKREMGYKDASFLQAV